MGRAIQQVSMVISRNMVSLCIAFYLLPSLTACGQDYYRATTSRPDFPEFGIEPELKAYSDSYPTPHSVSIRLADLGAEIAGSCDELEQPKTNRTYREIRIDRDTWNSIAEIQRLALIWHELNHCVANMDHDNRMQQNGCPVNIQHFRLPSEDCLLYGNTAFIQ